MTDFSSETLQAGRLNISRVMKGEKYQPKILSSKIILQKDRQKYSNCQVNEKTEKIYGQQSYIIKNV